jgi:hypothetical protein
MEERKLSCVHQNDTSSHLPGFSLSNTLGLDMKGTRGPFLRIILGGVTPRIILRKGPRVPFISSPRVFESENPGRCEDVVGIVACLFSATREKSFLRTYNSYYYITSHNTLFS